MIKVFFYIKKQDIIEINTKEITRSHQKEAELMNQLKIEEKNLIPIDTVSHALTSMYTGVFFIDLENDTYRMISAPAAIKRMLKTITSAQQAINFAIQKTVCKDEILDVITFVNLLTLPERMTSEKCLNIEYMGTISGWVRGSFIEAKRDKEGNLIQVLYAYQVIDEAKRKELDDRKYDSDFTKIVMDQIDCGVIAYTFPGRQLLQINREALSICGWMDEAEAQIQMKQWEDMICIEPEDKKKLALLQTQENSVKYQFKIKGEKEKYVLAESKSLSGRYGGKIIVSTIMDVTHMINLEADKISLTSENQELQQARDAVYTILNSGSYICSYDKTGETLINVKYSDALYRLYGYEGKEDTPPDWDMWVRNVYQEDKKYVLQSYRNALLDRTGNTIYDVTYRAMKKDGTIRWYRAAAHIIRREDGSADTCYGFVMDIDAQKTASDQLNKALKQAELASKAKTSFLSRMSHDIRTPINGIIGLIEINEKHAENIEFTRKNRRKAKVAADHLLSLINDVLQLSKLEDSNIELTEQPFHMLELTDDIFTIVEMKAHEHGIMIKREDDKNIANYPYLFGSPLHVRQIYLNILSNAIKYNKKNGRILCKAFASKIDEAHVLFRMMIQDTGIGMSEEFQKHMFDPFTREHEGMDTSRQGTGLGMSIVKQLVDKMNGTIKVESKLGEGTCFTVEIPFRIASAEDMMETKEPDRVVDLDGKHILLVEDNELNMDIAEILLSDAGVKITKAVNGQEAVEIFQNSQVGGFDVILMDIMMPIMNGYEATRKIRLLDRQDAKSVPIIAMTANAFMEDVKKAKEEGMNDHLAKPLDVKKMLSVIAKYIMN